MSGAILFVDVPGFGRCQFLRRFSTSGMIEVLTPGGRKIPVAERLTIKLPEYDAGATEALR